MTGVLLDPARGALLETLFLLAPILGIGLIVGLIVSIGQAVTSVQEQSLSFLPKLVAMIDGGVSRLAPGPHSSGNDVIEGPSQWSVHSGTQAPLRLAYFDAVRVVGTWM